MQVILRYVKAIAKGWSDWIMNAGSFFRPGFHQQLARRDAERREKSHDWLTPEEAVVAEALTKIIIPSEEDAPGIDEVCVLGPSAMTSLNKLIKDCPRRQYLYSRGLLSFDNWALKDHGCEFSTLSLDQQMNLFRSAQEMSDRYRGSGSLIAKVWRRWGLLGEIINGTFYAAMLYPMIRDDSLQIFYTSRVSWVWLEYDGPPMEKGYPNLAKRR